MSAVDDARAALTRGNNDYGYIEIDADTLRGLIEPPTDDQVDAAQIAFHEFVFGEEVSMTRRQLGVARQAWRAALEAAWDAS